MSETDSEKVVGAKKGWLRPWVITTLLFGILVIFYSCLLGPITPNLRAARQNASMQQARQIGLLLFAYSNDHNQHYPEGKTSTEVFQKLLDEKYVEDPAVFYIPIFSKTKPVLGQKLKPENVCFDMTCCLDAGSSEELPVVFTTGYKVNYVPGGTAVPLTKTLQQKVVSSTWFGWWKSTRGERPFSPADGIAVCYRSNGARFMWSSSSVNPDGSIPNFVSPDFKPEGKTYRQLTPDGMLGD